MRIIQAPSGILFLKRAILKSHIANKSYAKRTIRHADCELKTERQQCRWDHCNANILVLFCCVIIIVIQITAAVRTPLNFIVTVIPIISPLLIKSRCLTIQALIWKVRERGIAENRRPEKVRAILHKMI